MNKEFYDICYEVLSHYLNFPDVVDTYKSIGDGNSYLKNYPQNDFDFQNKKNDIIRYIVETRGNNFIYQCQESNKLFLPVTPGVSNKTLIDDDRIELRIQLENEISVLILKGIHQVIKHLYPTLDNNMLSAELLQQGGETLLKYGVVSGGQQQWRN
ncbi:MAG: hypothetical protein HDR02_04305 [Lachnospiraceae bacterium]|nr:hypothetical protein [Lachnospiraceae bacterium]